MELTLYHGTNSKKDSMNILANGFEMPDHGGNLRPGIYMSSQLSVAESYAGNRNSDKIDEKDCLLMVKAEVEGDQILRGSLKEVCKRLLGVEYAEKVVECGFNCHPSISQVARNASLKIVWILYEDFTDEVLVLDLSVIKDVKMMRIEYIN